MGTIRDLMQKITNLDHRRSVYNHIVDHLSGFLDNDPNKDFVVKTPGTGPVPKEIFSEVISEIEETLLKPVQEGLDALEGKEIEDDEDGEEEREEEDNQELSKPSKKSSSSGTKIGSGGSDPINPRSGKRKSPRIQIRRGRSN